jgi:hypothetical protein
LEVFDDLTLINDRSPCLAEFGAWAGNHHFRRQLLANAAIAASRVAA